MVNRANIQKVIDAISSTSPNKFYMGSWFSDYTPRKASEFHSCGTSACIAGWANVVERTEDRGDLGYGVISGAIKYLGINAQQANRLFFAMGSGTQYWDATPAQAVRVLEILRDEGVVSWSRAVNEILDGKPHKHAAPQLDPALAARAEAAKATLASISPGPLTTTVVPQPVKQRL